MADFVGELKVALAKEMSYSKGLEGMTKDISDKKEKYNPSTNACLKKVLETGMFKFLDVLIEGATRITDIVTEASRYEVDSLMIAEESPSHKWKLMFQTNVLFEGMSRASILKVDPSMYQCTSKIIKYKLEQWKGKGKDNNLVDDDEVLLSFVVHCLYNGARFINWNNEVNTMKMFPTLLDIEKIGDLNEEK